MYVIFDMDGLMFDTERIFIEAWDYAGEKMGIGKAGFMILKTLGMNIEKSNEVWREEFGDRYDPAELWKYTEQYLSDFHKKSRVPVKKGLYELLDYLKSNDVKMAVASSTSKWKVERNLQEAEVSHYFEGIVCGDMIEKSKPDPEIYLKACELLGAEPGDTYALEDSKSGLLSAYRAGCKPIMVPDLWQPDEEVLQFVVGVYDDLLKVREMFAYEWKGLSIATHRKNR